MANGNSTAARRARVKLQLRDSKGRWIEMGRSRVSWYSSRTKKDMAGTAVSTPDGKNAVVLTDDGQKYAVSGKKLTIVEAKTVLPSKNAPKNDSQESQPTSEQDTTSPKEEDTSPRKEEEGSEKISKSSTSEEGDEDEETEEEIDARIDREFESRYQEGLSEGRVTRDEGAYGYSNDIKRSPEYAYSFKNDKGENITPGLKVWNKEGNQFFIEEPIKAGQDSFETTDAERYSNDLMEAMGKYPPEESDKAFDEVDIDDYGIRVNLNDLTTTPPPDKKWDTDTPIDLSKAESAQDVIDIMEKKYPDLPITIDEAYLEDVKAVAEAFDENIRRYPFLQRAIVRFNMYDGSDDKGTYAYVSHSRNIFSEGAGLNMNIGYSAEESKEQHARDLQRGWNVPSKDYENGYMATMNHEFGHLLEEYAKYNSEEEYNQSKVADKVDEYLKTFADHSDGKGILEEELSEYGTTNVAETIAESVAEKVSMGREARPISQIVTAELAKHIPELQKTFYNSKGAEQLISERMNELAQKDKEEIPYRDLSAPYLESLPVGATLIDDTGHAYTKEANGQWGVAMNKYKADNNGLAEEMGRRGAQAKRVPNLNPNMYLNKDLIGEKEEGDVYTVNGKNFTFKGRKWEGENWHNEDGRSVDPNRLYQAIRNDPNASKVNNERAQLMEAVKKWNELKDKMPKITHTNDVGSDTIFGENIAGRPPLDESLTYTPTNSKGETFYPQQLLWKKDGTPFRMTNPTEKGSTLYVSGSSAVRMAKVNKLLDDDSLSDEEQRKQLKALLNAPFEAHELDYADLDEVSATPPEGKKWDTENPIDLSNAETTQDVIDAVQKKYPTVTVKIDPTSDTETAKLFMEAFDKNIRRYPELSQYIEQIQTFDIMEMSGSMSGAMAYVRANMAHNMYGGSNTKGFQFAYNPDLGAGKYRPNGKGHPLYGNLKGTRKDSLDLAVSKGQETGFFNPDTRHEDTHDSIAAHEFGHLMDYRAFGRSGGSFNHKLIDNKIKEYIEAQNPHADPRDLVKDGVSGYAKTNLYEIVAESVAQTVVDPETARPISKVVSSLLAENDPEFNKVYPERHSVQDVIQARRDAFNAVERGNFDPDALTGNMLNDLPDGATIFGRTTSMVKKDGAWRSSYDDREISNDRVLLRISSAGKDAYIDRSAYSNITPGTKLEIDGNTYQFNGFDSPKPWTRNGRKWETSKINNLLKNNPQGSAKSEAKPINKTVPTTDVTDSDMVNSPEGTGLYADGKALAIKKDGKWVTPKGKKIDNDQALRGLMNYGEAKFVSDDKDFPSKESDSEATPKPEEDSFKPLEKGKIDFDDSNVVEKLEEAPVGSTVTRKTPGETTHYTKQENGNWSQARVQDKTNYRTEGREISSEVMATRGRLSQDDYSYDPEDTAPKAPKPRDVPDLEPGKLNFNDPDLPGQLEKAPVGSLISNDDKKNTFYVKKEDGRWEKPAGGRSLTSKELAGIGNVGSNYKFTPKETKQEKDDNSLDPKDPDLEARFESAAPGSVIESDSGTKRIMFVKNTEGRWEPTVFEGGQVTPSGGKTYPSGAVARGIAKSPEGFKFTFITANPVDNEPESEEPEAPTPTPEPEVKPEAPTAPKGPQTEVGSEWVSAAPKTGTPGSVFKETKPKTTPGRGRPPVQRTYYDKNGIGFTDEDQVLNKKTGEVVTIIGGVTDNRVKVQAGDGSQPVIDIKFLESQAKPGEQPQAPKQLDEEPTAPKGFPLPKKEDEDTGPETTPEVEDSPEPEPEPKTPASDIYNPSTKSKVLAWHVGEPGSVIKEDITDLETGKKEVHRTFYDANGNAMVEGQTVRKIDTGEEVILGKSISDTDVKYSDKEGNPKGSVDFEELESLEEAPERDEWNDYVERDRRGDEDYDDVVPEGFEDLEYVPPRNKNREPESTPEAETPAKPEPRPEDDTLVPGTNIKRTEPTTLEGEKYPPTRQQQDVIDSVLEGKDTLVQAKAGSGKTSTLEAISRRLEAFMNNKPVLYIAFNKSVQTEADDRMPDNVESRTGHSLAYQWGPDWMRERMGGGSGPAGQARGKERQKNAIRNSKEVAAHLGIYRDINSGEESYTAEDQAKDVIEAVDRYAYSADDEIGAQHFEGKIDSLSSQEQATILEYAKRAWADLSDENGKLKFTFDHNRKHWALSRPDFTKGGHGWKPAEVLFLDEAQDTPPVLAKVVADQKMQKVIVGDADQAIYGFTGATDFLSKAKADVELPLNKSWRFGPEVADMGNRFLQLLGSKGRVVGGGPSSKVSRGMENPDAILTRTNAGMIVEILDQLERGRSIGVPKGTKVDMIKLFDHAEALEKGVPPRTLHEDLAKFKTWEEFAKEAREESNPKTSMIFKLIEEHGIADLKATLRKVHDPAEYGNKKKFGRKDSTIPQKFDDGVAIDSATGAVSGKGTYMFNERLKKFDKPNQGLKDYGYTWDGDRPARGGRPAYKGTKTWIPKDKSPEGRRKAAENLRDLIDRLQNSDAYLESIGGKSEPEEETMPPVDVTISTAHKSKGLEWGRVRIADDFREPKVDEESGKVIMPEDEELRLSYVAVTRAETELDPGGLGWVVDYTSDNGGTPEADKETPKPEAPAPAPKPEEKAPEPETPNSEEETGPEPRREEEPPIDETPDDPEEPPVGAPEPREEDDSIPSRGTPFTVRKRLLEKTKPGPGRRPVQRTFYDENGNGFTNEDSVFEKRSGKMYTVVGSKSDNSVIVADENGVQRPMSPKFLVSNVEPSPYTYKPQMLVSKISPSDVRTPERSGGRVIGRDSRGKYFISPKGKKIYIREKVKFPSKGENLTGTVVAMYDMKSGKPAVKIQLDDGTTRRIGIHKVEGDN